MGIFNRNKNVGGWQAEERGVPTLMLVKNQKIRKVIVCKLCLFFPKSKNTVKRKHT